MTLSETIETNYKTMRTGVHKSKNKQLHRQKREHQETIREEETTGNREGGGSEEDSKCKKKNATKGVNS